MKKLSIPLADGDANAFLFQPLGKVASPLVILYMDAFGPREALFGIAERIAGQGFNVFLPDLYYRQGEYVPFDPLTAFSEAQHRERIMGMIQSLSIRDVMADTATFLEYLAENYSIDTHRIGSLGYCMGGKFALAAASFFPGQVLAAASIHGGGLVTEQPDSPHLLVPGIKARVYIGIATDDRSFTDAHKLQLEQAFQLSDADAMLEVYPGAYHGFAMPDMSVFNPDASEKHWDRILKLFTETLPDASDYLSR